MTEKNNGNKESKGCRGPVGPEEKLLDELHWLLHGFYNVLERYEEFKELEEEIKELKSANKLHCLKRLNS